MPGNASWPKNAAPRSSLRVSVDLHAPPMITSAVKAETTHVILRGIAKGLTLLPLTGAVRTMARATREHDTPNMVANSTASGAAAS